MLFAAFIRCVALQSLTGLRSHGAYVVKQRHCSIHGLANILMYDICSDVSSRMWPRPRGQSSGLGLDNKVLGLGLGPKSLASVLALR